MTTISSYNITLPNLRYKDNDIIFIPRNPIKISVKKDIKYINELKLHNINFIGKIYNKEISHYVNYEIVRQELPTALKVFITIHSNNIIRKNNIYSIARDIEIDIIRFKHITSNDSINENTNNNINNDTKYDTKYDTNYDTNNDTKNYIENNSSDMTNTIYVARGKKKYIQNDIYDEKW